MWWSIEHGGRGSAEPAERLRGLPTEWMFDRELPVAATRRARLLGLAHLDRDAAGPGLLIPRCNSVHTFGMRFPIDVVFLDARGLELERRHAVPRRRVVSCRRAAAVAELVSPSGGEHAAAAS